MKTGTRVAAANALMGVGVAPMLLTAALLLLPWVAVLALRLSRYVG